MDETNIRASGSVTRLYERAKSGDEKAANELWQVYVHRLHGLAREVLARNGIVPAEATEESVVNHTFARFFDALRDGRYQKVRDRHELWCLLATITRNRALDQVKQYTRRRGYTIDAEQAWMQIAGTPANPSEAAVLTDLVSTVESTIRKRAISEDQADRIIRVFNMTLSGFTQVEVSGKIGRSTVTVRRHLDLIRNIVTQLLN